MYDVVQFKLILISFLFCNFCIIVSSRRGAAVPELRVQLDVFDEQREADEAQLLQGPHGVDLSSHLDVFYAILRQVWGAPRAGYSISFRNLKLLSFVASGCRHTAGDSLFKYSSAFAAY